MATFGSKKFEEESVRAYIKDKYCKAENGECYIPIRPDRVPGVPDEKICAQCDSILKFRYDEMKQAMDNARSVTVITLIRDSCRIGACKTSSYDCGVCGSRTSNLAKTTKEYMVIQKKACDAYLYRVFGVPRDGVGFGAEETMKLDSKMKIVNKTAFWINWRPFVGPDGRFECNYPALFMQMVKENARELSSIALEYKVRPKSEQQRKTLNRLSSVFGSANDASEDIYGEGGVGRSSSRASSRFSEKSRELLRKGSDTVKAFTDRSL